MNAPIHVSSLRARTMTVEPWGFPIQCEYEYDEGEMPIFWPTDSAHPGSPPNVQLLSCYIGGVEVGDMLSGGQIERIEAVILEELEN